MILKLFSIQDDFMINVVNRGIFIAFTAHNYAMDMPVL